MSERSYHECTQARTVYVWRGWGGGSSRRVGWQGPTILKRPTLPVEAKVNPLVNFIFILSMEGMKEMFYSMTHSTHFIYGYMASDIWLRTILIVRKETRCHHIGYSFHRHDSTYHGLCYTSRGALAGARYSSMGPP